MCGKECWKKKISKQTYQVHLSVTHCFARLKFLILSLVLANAHPITNQNTLAANKVDIGLIWTRNSPAWNLKSKHLGKTRKNKDEDTPSDNRKCNKNVISSGKRWIRFFWFITSLISLFQRKPMSLSHQYPFYTSPCVNFNTLYGRDEVRSFYPYYLIVTGQIF